MPLDRIRVEDADVQGRHPVCATGSERQGSTTAKRDLPANASVFHDARQLDDGAEIAADICIVGAGAAGITLAYELRDTTRDVLLVESGGPEAPDSETQSLYEGHVVGTPYFPLDICRLRFFGGTTNHWSGHCRPLDPIDFEKRAWVPYSGWPIGPADLADAYNRAQALCELGPFEYRVDARPELRDQSIPFDRRRIVNISFRHSAPTRFGRAYGDALLKARNVRVLCHANVTRIVTNRTASAVDGVEVRTFSGKRATIRARVLVLAAGAIENARLLLLSDGVEKNGLGNRYGNVGRFFMEHPHALAAFAVPTVELKRFEAYYSVNLRPVLAPEFQRREKLLNAAVAVGYGFDRFPGYRSVREVVREFAEGRLPDDLGRHVLNIIRDLDDIPGGLLRRLQHKAVLWFSVNAEQIPNPQSRMLLSRERDALGCRRAALDWRLTTDDKAHARRAIRVVGEELARLGLARMRLDPWLVQDDTTWNGLTGRYHHMGTTRMSENPRHGVVDADCRVHGVANLFVAGSSVFATSGYAAPTLTIVALAVRLANFLAGHRSTQHADTAHGQEAVVH